MFRSNNDSIVNNANYIRQDTHKESQKGTGDNMKTKKKVSKPVVRNNGYISVYIPKHPNCDVNGYMLQHRVKLEKKLKRYLLRTEVVHHIDGNVANNKIKNLMLFASSIDHLKHHAQLRAPLIAFQKMIEKSIRSLLREERRNKPCKFPECNKIHHAKEYCKKHWRKLNKYGVVFDGNISTYLKAQSFQD